MRTLRAFFLRIVCLFQKENRDSEFSAEMESHLRLHVEDNVRAGMKPLEARRQALLKLGGLQQTKEAYRERKTLPILETFLSDLRYGARMLGKTPAFTLIAVAILAIGIGSNTAVFSLIDALLLRSLAVPRPQELVHISFGPPAKPGPLSGSMFDRLRERQSSLTDLFGWTNSPMVLTENGVSRPIQAAYATGSAFPTLQLKPRLGRLLEWQDDSAVGASGFAAVISETFWIENFHADPRALGQSIIVNGLPATIVGVMPSSFNGITVDYAPQVVLPFAFDVALRGKASDRFEPSSTWLFVMGRLKPRVSLQQAQANLAAIASDVLKEALPANYQRIEDLRTGELSLSPGRKGNSPLGEVYGRQLWTLQALVATLFIICCANLASLQLSRSLSRRHELVIRSALGASRLRLARQLVVESTILAAAGASAGILLSQWLSVILVQYVEQSDFPVFLDLRPNASIFAWTIALAAVTVTLAGALPALSMTRFDTEATLRAGTQRNLLGMKSRLGARLLPLEVALSLLLVSMALLFAFSSGKLMRMDPGFRVKGVTFFEVDFARRTENGKGRLELYQRMLDALRHSPGVEAASMVAVRPLGEGGMEESAAPVEGSAPQNKHVFENIVGTDYFATAGTRVLAGREFSDFDRYGANPVCIVNQAAANSFFPSQDAVGKHLRPTEASATHPVCEIIGVVTDAKYLSLRLPAPPTIYHSYQQLPEFEWLGFITRSRETSISVTAFQDALHRFAPDTPLMPAVTMQRQLEDSVGRERLLAATSLFFGGLALLLTSIGLYGLESHRVTQRTPEIGLRMALGAQRRDVLWAILREATMFFVAGVPIGLMLTAVASRFVRNLLYEISPLDPRILMATVVVMLSAGFLAAYLPAHRATRVDPMVALRYE